MNKRADWLGWSLQFCVGAVIGAMIGFAIVARRRHGSPWLADELVAVFVTGAALLGGGLASRFGDRLWYGSSYNPLLSSEPEQNNISFGCSLATGGLGLALMLYAICRNLGVV